MRRANIAKFSLVFLLLVASFVWWHRERPPGEYDRPSPEGLAAVRIDRLSWLAGCWRHEAAGYRRDEQWMRPAGGTMVGMSRTVVDGRTVEFEYLRIEPHSTGLAYVANPSGQVETSFDLSALDDSAVVFEAPEHDFPQRIVYQRQSGGGVLAWIEGAVDGVAQTVEFPLTRARCP